MARPTNALIVDDEPHARTYVRLLLKEAGIENVWEASDGAQAMAVFTEHRPELVMLDVNLRTTTGLQLLQQMKQLRPEISVVMLTSENALKTVHESVRLGAVAYILKHSPKDKALESLQDALDVIEDGEEEEPAS
jgi:DNA-binding NtrC family response regulator